VSASIATSLDLVNLNPAIAHIRHILLRIVQPFHKRASLTCSALNNKEYHVLLLEDDISSLPISFPRLTNSPLLTPPTQG
jgi:hypothetical protein